MSNLAKDWQEGGYTVRVKDGEVEVSTIRTVTKTYLTCATDVHKKYVATARCAPEDEFSLSMGVALAMDRLSKELGKDKIEVGDKVKIKNCSKVYPVYVSWLRENLCDIDDIARYAYGVRPYVSDDYYKVLVIAPYTPNSDKKLAYIKEIGNTHFPCYLIEVDGLEKV